MKGQGHGRKILPFLLVMVPGMLLTGCGEEEAYTFNGVEPKEIDPWVYIQDTALSDSEQIRNFASSAGSLGITIGVMGIVFSILFMVIRIFFSGNVKTKSEVKEEALLKGILAIVIFSVPLWLGICKMLSEALV